MNEWLDFKSIKNKIVKGIFEKLFTEKIIYGKFKSNTKNDNSKILWFKKGFIYPNGSIKTYLEN